MDVRGIKLPKNLEEFKYHLKDPLYRNSFYILLTLISGAIFGFIFWIVAAKIYPQSDVGINTALISAVSLIAIISFLGLDQSIIRFFPAGNKLKILTTSCVVITGSTLIFGVLFVLGVDIWSPQLMIIRENLLPFFVALVAFTLTTPTAHAFIAMRKGEYYFYQNLVLGLRIVLVSLPFLGKLGIFLSFGISAILALLFSLIFIYKLEISSNIPGNLLDMDFLKESFHFSAGNYLFVLFVTIPTYLLPIMVLNLLGSEQTAYYYISYTIASLLFMISSAFSTSLFVEGSHGRSLPIYVLKSLTAIFLLLLPIAALLYIFGGYILGLIGEDYINGLHLLRMMVISSFFYAICQIYFSIGRVQKKVRELILLGSMIFILLIGLSYILMSKLGIIGIGYAWIISYLLVSLVVILEMWKLR